MRRQPTVSEWYTLLQPIGRLFGLVLYGLPWWIGLLLVAYFASNIRVVASDEEAMILRLGKVVAGGTPQALHPPGLLWAFPRPIDEVVVVKSKKIYEITIDELDVSNTKKQRKNLAFLSAASLDPERVGYMLSGDRNVLHLSLMLRYQISDPEAYFLDLQDPQTVIENAVLRAVLEQAGKQPVDRLLTDGRQDFVSAATKQAQQRLDGLQVGVLLLSLEVVDLQPPSLVRSDFAAVQTAYIEAQTLAQKSREYKAKKLPQARSKADASVREARAKAAKTIADARGGAQAFSVLATEHRKNPQVLRQRLYREKLDKVLKQAGNLRFVPPPVYDRYGDDFRITVTGSKP